MNHKKIFLASKSPRRKEILEELNLDFEIIFSDYEEKPLGLKPVETAKIHAVGKARGGLQNAGEGIVIGCDTFVSLGDKILEKPKNRNDAKRMILELSGKTHEVISGLCLINSKDKEEKVGVEITKVTFIELTNQIIENYLDVADYMDKAGAYGIQSEAKVFVDKIEGSLTNVVGLPKELLLEMLK